MGWLIKNLCGYDVKTFSAAKAVFLISSSLIAYTFQYLHVDNHIQNQ